MKARLLVQLLTDGAPNPPGTIVDHPDAYKLVRHGCAEPADEECAKAVGMSPEQLAKAQANYPMMAAAVAPEDREAWKLGYMRGYDADGNWIPGPNYDDHVEEEYAQRAEDAGIVLP